MAVERSGDYEPLLMPETRDWATALVFQPDNALNAWRGLLEGIEAVDFSSVPSDVVGQIFQKLIGPEERHRYGQHFTGDDVVDLINTFCIRSGRDVVLDPACGSGSFLVRAYYRKKHLEPDRAHLDLISDLFGCDIALYPAHLATLNLAAREINDETNYPRITRRNFFDFEPDQPFCELPDSLGARHPITLPPLDALVGNPPYVRQEKVEKADKARFGRICSSAWPGLKLSGRSDLHCYFWPAAARLVKPNGYFGFLTSSSWMDVEYGFALQGWILSHFRVLAIMESASEPWFEDARVKTCVTILQRCDDSRLRAENAVRFVRFSRPLSDIIGTPPGPNEEDRQLKLEEIRDRVLAVDEDYQDENFRIIVKRQKTLWRRGVRAGVLLKRSQASKTLVESLQSNAWVNIPEERPAVLLDSPLFPDHTVYFGRSRKEQVQCGSRRQAQLVLYLATLGVSGKLKIPGEDEAARELLNALEARLSEARRAFSELVESRTGNSRIRKQLLDVLQLWFVHGRVSKRRPTTAMTL